jgi:uncharacterized protein
MNVFTWVVSLEESGLIKVLVVDGFSNHDWVHTTRCIGAILTEAEGFHVSVSTYPEDAHDVAVWNPAFEKYDVVIQTCNDLGGGPRWPQRVEADLEAYVKNGGGLFIFHAGNNAFEKWDAYNRMIGLGWRDKNFGWAITIEEDGSVVRVPAGDGEKTSHGPRIDAQLTRLGDHPIHQGMPRQWVAADIEVYRYARGPAENLTVLSYTKDPTTGINFPIEWTVIYGKGQIYNSTLGHVWKDQTEPKGVCCVGFQTLLSRGVQWLAKKDVLALPEDFPTPKTSSLRPYPVPK